MGVKGGASVVVVVARHSVVPAGGREGGRERRGIRFRVVLALDGQRGEGARRK